MITPAFKEAYSRLNPRQKDAVDAIDGPVMVIAGPGTGKTQILTLRIANILANTDTAPENILALTFTESAAANMRKRLVGLIGTEGYYVQIATFHGFANRLIQENPEDFPDIIGGRNATEVDQISFIREILASGDYECLKPIGDKFHYVGDILSAIRHLKNEGLEAEDLRRLNKEKRKKIEDAPDLRHEKGRFAGNIKSDYQKQLKACDKNAELADVYAKYQEHLRAAKMYDFEDMLLGVIRAFEADKSFLLSVEEQYQYLLVDEHQDTNGAQNRILELIAGFHENPNLFVVGDEKQAIYRFQGASLENFLYFKNKFPNAKFISLEDNYRSTQHILDSATALIENNAATVKAPLRSALGGEDRPIKIFDFGSDEAEYLFLAEKIKELAASGVVPAEIAVLYRENRDAYAIAESLSRNGVPFALESDQNLLEDPDIRKMIRLLAAINELGRNEVLAEALHIDFLEMPPLDIWKMLSARAEKRVRNLHDVLAGKEILDSLGLEAPEKARELGRKLSAWKRQAKNEHFLRFFPELVRESGYLSATLSNPGYFEKIGRLNAFFDEAKKAAGSRGDYRLADFMEYIRILEEHKVKIKAPGVLLPNSVRLMTAHKAKGLEFDEVFIVGATDGHWGNRRNFGGFDLPFRTSVDASELEKNEDERRLFYMAMTRARKGIWITYSTKAADGRERVPSQFLGEIKAELKEHVSGREYGDRLLSDPGYGFRKTEVPVARLEDKDFLKELFEKKGLSATALNNYLACPWRYVYRNLLRLPEAQTNPQMYGTAVHAALERFFKARAEGEPAGREFILERYEEELGRLPLAEEDLRSLLVHGKKVLGGYYEEYAASWNYRTISEFKVDTKLGEVLLTGKLDKVEFEDAGGITVVDYKVRKPMSRNEIEGATKNSTGDYKRQLVFYKILLDGHPEGSYRMRRAVLDFVEPNDAGKFKQEVFEISDAESEALKKEIGRAAAEILGLEFWDKTCGKKDCEYCGLRKMQGAELVPLDENNK